MVAGLYILKLIVILIALGGWNEAHKSKRLPPRYWFNENKFKRDSVINRIDSTSVYVIKLRKL